MEATNPNDLPALDKLSECSSHLACLTKLSSLELDLRSRYCAVLLLLPPLPQLHSLTLSIVTPSTCGRELGLNPGLNSSYAKHLAQLPRLKELKISTTVDNEYNMFTLPASALGGLTALSVLISGYNCETETPFKPTGSPWAPPQLRRLMLQHVGEFSPRGYSSYEATAFTAEHEQEPWRYDANTLLAPLTQLMHLVLSHIPLQNCASALAQLTQLKELHIVGGKREWGYVIPPLPGLKLDLQKDTWLLGSLPVALQLPLTDDMQVEGWWEGSWDCICMRFLGDNYAGTVMKPSLDSRNSRRKGVVESAASAKQSSSACHQWRREEECGESKHIQAWLRRKAPWAVDCLSEASEFESARRKWAGDEFAPSTGEVDEDMDNEDWIYTGHHVRTLSESGYKLLLGLF